MRVKNLQGTVILNEPVLPEVVYEAEGNVRCRWEEKWGHQVGELPVDYILSTGIVSLQKEQGQMKGRAVRGGGGMVLSLWLALGRYEKQPWGGSLNQAGSPSQ